MKLMFKYAIVFWGLMLCYYTPFAQDTIFCVQISNYASTYGHLKPRSFYIPAVAIGYGVLAQQKNRFNQLDHDIKNAVVPSDRTRKLHLDNYLQFAPGAITLGLTAAGVKGNQNLCDAAITYALTNVIFNAAVIPVKHYVHRLRPDSSAVTSFPSGHTTAAFANAEFMRMQYGKKYPWLAVAGYAMAGTTGFLRMYNNKHWFSDVLTGAAIGFCSARLAGWMYTHVKPFLCSYHHKDKRKITGITPEF